MNKNLLDLIQSKKATIGIIGLGYVGLPLSLRFADKGFKTIGFDIDSSKVNMINNGESYINHIKKKKILHSINKGFEATVNFELISEVDVIIICVPTPLTEKQQPDLSYIRSTLSSIKNHLKEDQLLVLESTSYPGTTEEELLSFINKIPNKRDNGNPKFDVGNNFFIGYSPEREDPGNNEYSIKNIPKIVSGISKNCLSLTNELYDKIVDETVPVSSTKIAEMAKILENIQRAVNIGLMNEMKIICIDLGIDIFEAIKAASTKPFGFSEYYPGPGLGGHCIPVDPFYFAWKANKKGIKTEFIKLAADINSKMPDYVVSKTEELLVEKGMQIKNCNILVLGLSYKKNIDDIRESPSLAIIDLLMKKDAKVQYSDPYIDFVPETRKYEINLKSINLTSKKIQSFDVIILATDHDEFDYNKIFKHSKLIIDTKGYFGRSEKICIA